MSPFYSTSNFGARWARLAAVCAVLFSLASCQDHRVSLPGQGIQPKGPKPAYAPTITPQMQAVVEELALLNPTSLSALSPAEARTKPSFKDAVNSLLSKNNIAQPMFSGTKSTIMVAGADGAQIRAVMYKPTGAASSAPAIVYYHGGGWVIASPEVYEYSAIALARNTGAVVISVDYRLAPENKFPVAHEDAYAAYKWVRDNASSLGINPAKIALAGESAGGNMAITTAMLARDRNYPLPVHILSVFPVANNNLETPSYKQYADAMPLNRPLIQWFVDKYFRSMADGDNQLISLVDVANLNGLPPVTIIGAEIDPLQSEGMYLRDELKRQNSQRSNYMVNYQLYTGVTHEFFGMYAIVPEAAQAQEYAANKLLEAFK